MYVRYLHAAALAVALLAPGCARTSAPDPALEGPPVDPVGAYSFSSQAGGENFQGTIRINRTGAGAYAGTVSTPLTGDLPVRTVAVRGRRVRVTFQGPRGDAVVELDHGGPSYAGNWTYGGFRGFLVGRFAPGADAAFPEHLPATGEPGTEYAGTYGFETVALQVRIYEQGGQLMLHPTDQRAFPLVYLGGHRFRGPERLGAALEFTVEDGRATGFSYTQRGAEGTYLARRIQ